jgi:hypothetical protein
MQPAMFKLRAPSPPLSTRSCRSAPHAVCSTKALLHALQCTMHALPRAYHAQHMLSIQCCNANQPFHTTLTISTAMQPAKFTMRSPSPALGTQVHTTPNICSAFTATMQPAMFKLRSPSPPLGMLSCRRAPHAICRTKALMHEATAVHNACSSQAMHCSAPCMLHALPRAYHAQHICSTSTATMQPAVFKMRSPSPPLDTHVHTTPNMCSASNAAMPPALFKLRLPSPPLGTLSYHTAPHAAASGRSTCSARTQQQQSSS